VNPYRDKSAARKNGVRHYFVRQRTFRNGGAGMMVFCWILVGLAITVQLLNLVYLRMDWRGPAPVSQVHLVPCLLWGIALLVSRKPFFLDSRGLEFGAVVLVHVLLSVVLPDLLDWYRRRRHDGSR